MPRPKDRLKIITWGHPDLKEVSQAVKAVDQEIIDLVKEMFATMYRAPGVGLAAPQVDILKRVCVIGFDEDGQHEKLALINPVITGYFGYEVPYDEGCLSFPGIHAQVYRPQGVFVEAIGLDERPLKLQAEGFLARVLQHEIDHLDGTVFIERLDKAAQERLAKPLDRLHERSLKAYQKDERKG